MAIDGHAGRVYLEPDKKTEKLLRKQKLASDPEMISAFIAMGYSELSVSRLLFCFKKRN